MRGCGAGLLPGEVLFPGPGGGEGVFDASRGLPAEFAVGHGRVGPDGRHERSGS